LYVFISQITLLNTKWAQAVGLSRISLCLFLLPYLSEQGIYQKPHLRVLVSFTAQLTCWKQLRWT